MSRRRGRTSTPDERKSAFNPNKSLSRPLRPASKWLEDRAGRTLTEDEIGHYRRMLAALRETLWLLPQIDAIYAG